MQWFSESEWPYINMVNALCSYVGLAAVFAMTVPIYVALGSSWQAVLRYYGFGVAAIALAWTVLGRERNARQVASGHVQESVLLEVMKMRSVILLSIGLFGGMWVFQLYTAFLPQFFHTYRGFAMNEAAQLTAILPLTGIFAAAGGGIGTGLIGLRKPFTWPLIVVATIGCIGAVALPSPAAIRLSLVLFGIGAAGNLAPIITLLMELPAMTPAKVGTSLALMWACGYAGAFGSPFLGGALAALVGLKTVLLGFLVFQALPIVCMCLLPETGRGRPPVAVPAAAVADR